MFELSDLWHQFSPISMYLSFSDSDHALQKEIFIIVLSPSDKRKYVSISTNITRFFLILRDMFIICAIGLKMWAFRFFDQEDVFLWELIVFKRILDFERVQNQSKSANIL